MRVLFLAFMIVLLPLRGWVGDAMAMDMIASGHGAAPSAHASATTTAHDCHTQAGDDAQELQAPQPPMTADCGTCSACQICHTIALPNMRLLLPSNAAAPVQASHPVGRYASADRIPGFKPPIS